MTSLPPVPIGKIGKAGIHGAGFSILSLSPILWLDASDLSTITANSGSVSQWDDKSGAGHNASQSVASEQPQTGTRSVNGLNVLNYDGVNDNMDLDYSTLLSVPSGDNTVFMVWATDDPSRQQRVMSGFVSGGTRWGLLYEMIDDNLTGVNATSYNPVHNAQTQDTNPHIDFMRRSSTNVEIGRDGGSNSTTESKGADVTLNNIRIASTLGGTSAVDGLIAEILLFDRALPDAQMNIVGAYLAQKWSISWTII